MDAQATTNTKPPRSELLDASYAALDSKAATEDARKLVETLCNQITATEERLGRRQHHRVKTAAQFQAAVEAFVADLLRAHAYGNGLVYRSLRPASFTGKAVSYRTFVTVCELLTEIGLVESWSGYQDTVQFEGGPKLGYNRHATRFRAKQALLDLCAQHGVAVADVDRHFLLPLPEQPLQLRASSSRNGFGEKVRGKLMPIRRPIGIEEAVRELNEFLDSFELRGGTHRGYLRVFNNGDHPDFAWNMGGRFYSQGEANYQQMSKDERLRMTIDGEPVCEIDIRASYLTIFYAWNGANLDPHRDPYDLPGLGPDARPVVKAWFVATFGIDTHLDKWPKQIAADYRARTCRRLSKDYPIARIREKAFEAHPVLARWGQPIDVTRMNCWQDHPMLDRWRDGTRRMGWADLMYLESAAVLYAMQVLRMGHGIPSLSMHDSLIVPVSNRDVAVDAIRKGYARMAIAEPITLAVHHPGSEGDESNSTVLYGDDDEESQDEAAEADPVSSGEDSDDGWEWAANEESSVDWSRIPHDPNDPDDPRNF
jgi:hypothetical protein